MRARDFVVWIGLCACACAEREAERPELPLPKPVTETVRPVAEPAPPRFRVDRESANTLRVRPVDGECPWLEYAPQGGSLRFRSDRVGCEPVLLSAHEKTAYDMVKALEADLGEKLELTSFVLGRYPEFYARVAEDALTAPAWDKRRGRPTQPGQSNNALVVALGAEPAHFGEVVRLFAPLGYDATLSSVEKVFVGKVDETPFADALRAAGAAPTDKVPYDSSVGFRLTRGQ